MAAFPGMRVSCSCQWRGLPRTDGQCQKQVQTARLRVNPQPPPCVKHQMPGLSPVRDKVLLGGGMTVKLLQHPATSLHQGMAGLRLRVVQSSQQSRDARIPHGVVVTTHIAGLTHSVPRVSFQTQFSFRDRMITHSADTQTVRTVGWSAFTLCHSHRKTLYFFFIFWLHHVACRVSVP